MNPQNYVGNVYGNVLDRKSGKPINGAEIYILYPNEDLQNGKERINGSLLSSTSHFKPKGITDRDGAFLINFVPAPNDGKDYELLVEAPCYLSFIVPDFLVTPGAIISPKFMISLKRGIGDKEFIDKNKLDSIVTYIHSKHGESFMVGSLPTQIKKKYIKKVTSIEPQIYATDEGLVEHTTSNGHVIF